MFTLFIFIYIIYIILFCLTFYLYFFVQLHTYTHFIYQTYSDFISHSDEACFD